MNIQLLLSANPSQGSGASASQATGAQSISNGLFRQAMLQANEGQPRLSHELTSSTAPATSDAALNEFASLLESLGIELNQEALAQLFAQLQMAEQPSAEQLTALPGAISGNSETPLSALDEISSRLSLVAAFTGTSSDTAETTSIAAIAEQLAISQQDAVVLVGAYQQLTDNASHQGSPQRLETLNQQLAALLQSNQAVNTATDSQPSASSTLTASSQTFSSNVRVSSDAMASALVVSGSSGETAARLGSGNDLAFNLPSANAPTVAAATGTALTSSIGTPVSHPAWPSQLGQQLVHVAQRGGEQHIQMKLHPAELGPLSISLKMTEHGAQAQFLSAHAQVRQVIEQAIPQLREALAEQGISLGETSVGEQNASNEQAFAQQNTGTASLGEGNGLEGETEAPVEGVPVALDGRVDLYA
ncbi:flagellar hook-length control protein FliK [Halomonas sp. LY9]